MNTCKYCGKPLILTPEFDTCMECQGRIIRETIYGNNGGFATNSTKTATKVITHEEARKIARDMLPKQVGSRSSQNKVNKYFELDLYFKQQEKKEERAKKVEEELEKYKISDKSKEESSIEYYNLYKETKRKLKKVEKLLGSYIKLAYYANYDVDDIETKERVLELKDEITQLKKELEVSK